MFPKEGRLALLEYLPVSTTQIWDKKFRLAKDIAAGDDEDLELGDFTECDFDGYAPISDPAFDPATINGVDRGQIDTETLTWTAGAGISGAQTIKAIYMTIDYATGGERLFLFWRLSPTVSLAAPDEEFSRIVRILDDDLGV